MLPVVPLRINERHAGSGICEVEGHSFHSCVVRVCQNPLGATGEANLSIDPAGKTVEAQGCNLGIRARLMSDTLEGGGPGQG